MFMITKLRKISSGQFYVMLLLTNTVFIFTLSELSVKPYELLPSLIPLLISTAISLFMFYFSYSVAIKSGKSVLEYITIKNKPLANVFKAIYLFYFLYAGSLILLSYTNLFVTSVNRSAVMWFIILSMCLSCIYSGVKGLESLSRSCIIIFAFFVITVLIVTVGNFTYFDFDNLMNVKSKENPLDSLVFYISTGILPSASAVLINRVKNNSFTKAALWQGVAYIIDLVLVLSTVLVLGSFSLTQQYPVFSLSQTSGFSLFKGADGLAFALITFVAFIGLSLMTICFNNTVSKEQSKISTVISVLLIFVLSLPATLSDAVSSFVFNKYILFALTVVTGFVIPLASYLMKRREKGA